MICISAYLECETLAKLPLAIANVEISSKNSIIDFKCTE